MMNFTKSTVAAAVIAVSASSYVQAAQETAPAFVKRIADDLVDRLEKTSAADKKNPKVLYAIVQENIEPHVNFPAFSKGVMGKHYRRASALQRATFEKNLRRHLIFGYSKFLGDYDGQTYKIRPFRQSKSPKPVVTVDFKTGSQVVPISFQLENKNNAWKIRNVKGAGVDIGLTFRKQFSSTVEANRNNLDKAIANFVPKAQTK